MEIRTGFRETPDFQFDTPDIYNRPLIPMVTALATGIFVGGSWPGHFLEAMGTIGNGPMYPDMENETPDVMVHLDRQEQQAKNEHEKNNLQLFTDGGMHALHENGVR